VARIDAAGGDDARARRLLLKAGDQPEKRLAPFDVRLVAYGGSAAS